MSDIYKIDVDTSTGVQLLAQARAALDGIVNDICRDADLSYDGTAAHICIDGVNGGRYDTEKSEAGRV